MGDMPLRLFANAAVLSVLSLTPCLASAQESAQESGHESGQERPAEGSSLPALPPTAPPPANPAANAPNKSVHTARITPSVLVHVDGPDALEIQADLDSVHHAWETVCTAPCDRALSSDLRYRLNGGGLRTSEPFSLSAPEGTRDRIGVRGGSKTWFILGWIGVGVGGAVAIVGFDVLLAPVISSMIVVDGPRDTSNHPGHPVIGWSLVGGGVALALSSLAVVIRNRRASVTQETMTEPTAQPEAERRAALHPAHDASIRDALPMPTIVAPIFHVTF